MDFITRFLDSAKTQDHVETQVVSVLPLKVLEYTGGEFNEDYSVSNIVSKYDNVYCANRNHCTVVFAIESRLPMITEINVVAPPHNRYTSPVQHIAIFLSMAEDCLVERTNQYITQSPIAHIFTPQDQELHASLDRKETLKQFYENWKLFDQVLSKEPETEEKEEADYCAVRYHLCHPSYKLDPGNGYAQVLDMGSHKTRMRLVASSSSSGSINNKPTLSSNADLSELCDYNLDDYNLNSTQGISAETHTIKTRVSDAKWKSDGSLEPIALATIPVSSEYRHMRIRFSKPMVGRYLAVKFSNTSVRSFANVDIESFAVRGVVNENPSITFR